MHSTLNSILQPDSGIQTALRRAVTFASVGVMLVLGSMFVADIRKPMASVAPANAESSFAATQRASAQEDALRIGQEHLFGQAYPAAAAAPVQTVSDISLSGILFSDHQDESRAIFVVGGQTVIVAPGGTLPDAEVLRTIAQDRVTLERNGVLVSVLLDIRNADANSRTALIALNGGASGGDTGPDLAPMSGPDDAQQAGISWTSQQGMGQGRITHGAFLPLSAIRGDPAKLHIMAPGIKPPGSHE